METRELYRQKYAAQIKEWGAKVDEIQARFQKSAAEAQIGLKPHVDGAKTKFDTVKSKLGHMAKATDAAWDGVKHDADGAWHDFKASVEGAFSALSSHQKADHSKPVT